MKYPLILLTVLALQGCKATSQSEPHGNLFQFCMLARCEIEVPEKAESATLDAHPVERVENESH